MNIALIIQIVMSALRLAPIEIDAYNKIMAILANDPAVPPDLKALLQKTADNNSTGLAEINAWIAANPE